MAEIPDSAYIEDGLTECEESTAMLLKIKCQPSAMHKSIILALEFLTMLIAMLNIWSKPSASASPGSERLDERGGSTSARALLAELSPVPTVKTTACIHVRSKTMARELTGKQDSSAAKKKVSTRKIVAVSEDVGQQRRMIIHTK
jgi:hypothetical protein